MTRQIGRFSKYGPHAQAIVLVHGFPDRLRDADSIAYPGVPSPRRRANQSPRVPPIAFERADRYADHIGRLLHAQAGVIAELDDLRELCVLRLEPLDRLVQGEQIAGRRFDPGQALGQLAALGLASVFETPLMARLLDQDLTHCLRGCAEEMAPAFPAGIVVPHADTPRGRERLAGGSDRGSTGPSRLRRGCAAPRRELATIRPPAASPGTDFVHRDCVIEEKLQIFGPPAAPFSDCPVAGRRTVSSYCEMASWGRGTRASRTFAHDGQNGVLGCSAERVCPGRTTYPSQSGAPRDCR